MRQRVARGKPSGTTACDWFWSDQSHPTRAKALRDSGRPCSAHHRIAARLNALSPTSWHRPRVRFHPRRGPSADCAGVAEQEQVPAQRLTRQTIADETVQPLEPLAHVGDPGGQMDPCSWAQSKHGLRPLQDAHQAFQCICIEIRIYLDPPPARQHHGQPTTRFVQLRRFPGRQLHRHGVSQFPRPVVWIAELPHRYVAWALTTLFLRSSGHFNTDPACRTVEQVCWSDAYDEDLMSPKVRKA